MRSFRVRAGLAVVLLAAAGAAPAGAPVSGCPAAPHVLREIVAVQGPGALSPLAGETVTVRGVVVGGFRGPDASRGFFIQQPVPGPDGRGSEGLFVHAPGGGPAVGMGDLVQVSGTVEEHGGSGAGLGSLTRIGRVSAISVCARGPEIAPKLLSLPVADLAELEAAEGMLVRFAQPLHVTGNDMLGRHGELVLSAPARLFHPNNDPARGDATALADLNRRSRIVLDDGQGFPHPDPIPYLPAGPGGTRRVGDVVEDLQGVLSQAFGSYRIHPTRSPVFRAGNPRPAAPAAVGGTLRAASLNVLSYFTTPGRRGAASAEELRRQKAKLVETIAGLDADVLGLMEIENNAEALRDLLEATNARMGAGSYALVHDGPAGTDAIRVAIVYRPARLRPVGEAAVPTDAGFAVGPRLRPPLAQRFAARQGAGGFWFVVSHLKSKASCPGGPSDPDADRGQGCWNATRTRQAGALARWVAGLAAASGEADVLLVGDFNAYPAEDPVLALEAAGYENLLGRMPPAERYSYVFRGESGALDHAFASRSLRSRVTGVTVWHVNADEPPVLDYRTGPATDDRYAATPFRSSDHDPVLVGLDLARDAPAAAPPQPCRPAPAVSAPSRSGCVPAAWPAAAPRRPSR